MYSKQPEEIMKVAIKANINYAALREAIEAVEENNRINDGMWIGWDDASHVAETYGIELDEQGAKIINRAIESNGESLTVDLPAVERAVWGQNFFGSFWNRTASKSEAA